MDVVKEEIYGGSKLEWKLAIDKHVKSSNNNKLIIIMVKITIMSLQICLG